MLDRRGFIKGSAAAVLATTTAGFSNIIVPRKRPLGVALVGLGYYSTDLLGPALQLTKYCELKGIVTGSPWKIPIWQEKYGIKDRNVYNYSNMESMAENSEIDVVYIVLPTSMHSEYGIKAAKAGKHVWCEKPMARTADECQALIDTCHSNGVRLSVGYRMQHEPNTQRIINFRKENRYGKIVSLAAHAGYYDGRTKHWKFRKEMGGGAMYDMGVYPLNAARYVTQEEPVAVLARHEVTREQIFKEVDETTYFTLRFPSGAIADCSTSLGKTMNDLDVTCQDGWYGLSPFQAYNGIRGKTSDGLKLNAKIPNQQAKQMDDDSLSILEKRPMLVSGDEGLKDIRIVEAAYQSAATTEEIQL